LISIIVDEDNTSYNDIDGVLFDSSGTTLIVYPIGNTRTSYQIPENITSITEYAFYNALSLTSITIPSSVTTIGSQAFSSVTALTYLTIPENVITIEPGAFYGCNGLLHVTFTGNMIPPDISNNTAFPPKSQGITAYYTQDLSQNYIDILTATFQYVSGPDLFNFIDSPTLGTDYTYLVQNGSSSVSDRYSIISVLPAASDGVKFSINVGPGTDWDDYQIGVVLVGPGETPASPPTNQGSPTYFVQSSGGQGGASIYADLSANDILTNEITLHCGITNTQSDPLMYSSMDISNTTTTWICGDTLQTESMGASITHTVHKQSTDGGYGYGGNSFTIQPMTGNVTWLNQDLSGNDSDWIDSVPFLGSSITLTGYGGGGGTGENTSGGGVGGLGQVGQAGQGGVGGDSGTSAPETDQWGISTYYGYYNSNASPGGGGGGPSLHPSVPGGWSSSGTGGSGLAYFYIGYKAPSA